MVKVNKWIHSSLEYINFVCEFSFPLNLIHFDLVLNTKFILKSWFFALVRKPFSPSCSTVIHLHGLLYGSLYMDPLNDVGYIIWENTKIKQRYMYPNNQMNVGYLIQQHQVIFISLILSQQINKLGSINNIIFGHRIILLFDGVYVHLHVKRVEIIIHEQLSTILFFLFYFCE